MLTKEQQWMDLYPVRSESPESQKQQLSWRRGQSMTFLDAVLCSSLVNHEHQHHSSTTPVRVKYSSISQ